MIFTIRGARILIASLACLAILASPRTACSRTLAVLNGNVPGDTFGGAVAGVGDQNGDGMADVIVGAYQSDVGGLDAGRAYVFHGGRKIDVKAHAAFGAQAAGDLFGVSVATAGDVNKDGFPDIIVGAHENDAAGANAGRAYIYFGGPAGDNRPDVTLTGEAAGDAFGYSVAGAGDVNGDGYADVIVGAYENSTRADGAGRAYVYYGGSRMDGTPDAHLQRPGRRRLLRHLGRGRRGRERRRLRRRGRRRLPVRHRRHRRRAARTSSSAARARTTAPTSSSPVPPQAIRSDFRWPAPAT